MNRLINFSSLKFGSFSWKKDLFDSKILKRNVAKIEIFSPKPSFISELTGKLVADLKENNIDYATIRFPATQFPMIHEFERSGFLLVDCSVSLGMNLKNEFKDIPKQIRQAKNSDIPMLQKIAGGSFHLNRFYNDSVISKDQADEIYSQWIKNSLEKKQADSVFVWEENERICGFTTLKKSGNIVLIAVDNNHRGKGIAKNLIKRSLNQFIIWRLKNATIETQMTNIPALRAYQACGFKIEKVFVTYRWSK